MTTLLSIAVTPAHPEIPVNGTSQLTATGTYDDIDPADITASCAWTSSATGTATVGAATGLVTGVAGHGVGDEPARATITATSGTVQGTAEVAVSRARDFYAAVDCQSVTSYTKTSFGLQAGQQALANDAAWAVDVSWDGVNAGGQIPAGGAMSWSGHTRSGVWLKRNTGTGGGVGNVRIFASEGGL